MASSSDNLTPIAIVDDHDTDLSMSGQYPDLHSSSYRDMINESYHQTLTYITTPSWTGSYIFDGTYTRVAVYICLPPAATDSSQAAFASYSIDGMLQATSYVPFTDIGLYIPRYAHFSSDLLLAIPGGHHNLTIQVSADPSHPYLLDYLVLWDKYLGPDHPYPGSPTYISTFSASSTPAQQPEASAAATSATLSFSGSTILTSSFTASTLGDALPTTSSAPPPSLLPASHIVGAVVGSVVASAALLAVSYVMYRHHRKHGHTEIVPPRGAPRAPDSQSLMAEADATAVTTRRLGAAESHLYDVPTTTAEGLYSTLVRHQTGKGKIKEIRLQPSRTGLDASYDSMPDTSAESSALFDDTPNNLPLYSSSSAPPSPSRK
ncbi:hypothetical protein V8D89_013816 [Ganoderma adspersum]